MKWNFDIDFGGPKYVVWFGCGFAAYYLRYGNQWQGNEVRFIYNVLFGALNLIGWCLEWLGSVYPFTLQQSIGWLACLALVTGFLWLCRLPPFQGHRYWFK